MTDVNLYETPPISSAESNFLISSGTTPELIELYKKARAIILPYGKIEVWATRNYLSFKHPYGRNDERIGTLVNISFNKNSMILAFNMRKSTPSDPTNLLRETNSHGVCNYYGIIKNEDDLSGLSKLIEQAIYCVSHKHRIVRINGKFITI